MSKKYSAKLFVLTVIIPLAISFISKVTATEIFISDDQISEAYQEQSNSFIQESHSGNKPLVTPVKLNIAQASQETIAVTDIPGFTSVISSLALTSDGKILLVATGGGTVNAIDLSNSQLIYSKTFVAETRDIALTADNNLFAVALGEEIGIINLNEQKVVKRWPAHVEKITQIAISPDNKYIVSISAAERTTKIWDLATGDLLKTLGEGQGVASRLLFNPSGQFLVTAASGNDRTLKFWDVQTWELLTSSPQQPGNIYDLAMTPDGTKLIAAIRNKIKVWDMTTGAETLSWKVADLDLNAVAISPNGNIVATADKEEKIKLWNLNDGKLLATLTGHKGWVLSLVFSPDGNYLYSGAEDKLVKVWAVQPIVNPNLNEL